VSHVFGEHLLRGVDQDVGFLGLEGEVQIEPGELVLEVADRLATAVAPGDANRMQEWQFDCPVLGEQGGASWPCVTAARNSSSRVLASFMVMSFRNRAFTVSRDSYALPLMANMSYMPPFSP
jgi:hypothetical protein